MNFFTNNKNNNIKIYSNYKNINYTTKYCNSSKQHYVHWQLVISCQCDGHYSLLPDHLHYGTLKRKDYETTTNKSS